MDSERIELIRHELRQMAKSHRDEWLKYENRIHREYFEPFDQLLEKKAQYYLSQAEKGNENKWLLQEIEIMERFREYVTVLETVSQRHLDQVFDLAGRAVKLTYLVDYHKNLFRNTVHSSRIEILRLKRLQEQCKQP